MDEDDEIGVGQHGGDWHLDDYDIILRMDLFYSSFLMIAMCRLEKTNIYKRKYRFSRWWAVSLENEEERERVVSQGEREGAEEDFDWLI